MRYRCFSPEHCIEISLEDGVCFEDISYEDMWGFGFFFFLGSTRFAGTKGKPRTCRAACKCCWNLQDLLGMLVCFKAQRPWKLSVEGWVFPALKYSRAQWSAYQFSYSPPFSWSILMLHSPIPSAQGKVPPGCLQWEVDRREYRSFLFPHFHPILKWFLVTLG